MGLTGVVGIASSADGAQFGRLRYCGSSVARGERSALRVRYIAWSESLWTEVCAMTSGLSGESVIASVGGNANV